MGVWGAHIGADQLEINSWRDAANTTWEEGLGFSTILIAPQDIDSLVQGWLRYIDATVYEDVATGLLKIKLVREADLSGAPAFTADQISDVKATRVSYSELRGTVKVTYTDANRNYETGGVMARNSAVTRALGGATDLEVVELPGFSQTDVAQKAAGQLLRASSYPLSKIEITGDQSLNQLNPGQPFHLTWSRPSINAYFRVTKVNIREITEGGVIVHAIEDIFAAASNTFTPPPSTGIGGAGDVYPRTIQ
jgi:Putative phage tail protein